MHWLLVSGAPFFPPTTLIYIFINIFAKYYVFFPVTSQTLENCLEEVRSVVSQILNGAANAEPITMTTTMLPVPATPSTSGAKPSPSTSGAKPFFDPVTMSAPQGPLPGKTLLLNLFWCLVFSTKTWWLVFSFVASFLGGLSLHLNHLIASHVANYDWPFNNNNNNNLLPSVFLDICML